MLMRVIFEKLVKDAQNCLSTVDSPGRLVSSSAHQ